jgi:hypothetical protein
MGRLHLNLVLHLTAFITGSNAIPVSEPTEPRVDLGYATYEGTSLGNGVKQFLGMRYAAPPIGDNRFRHAQDPLKEYGIVPAKEVRSCLSFHFFFSKAMLNNIF